MLIEAGFIIYDPQNLSKSYPFDKSLGRGNEEIDFIHNENRLELKTFGKFPFVYYAGQTNYITFELSTVFIPTDEDPRSAYIQAQEFVNLTKQKIPLVVESSLGEKWICDVELTDYKRPKLYTELDFDYVQISVKCTQIDE